MYVTHIGLYDHYVGIANEEEKFNVCFEPMRVLQLKRKNLMWVWNPIRLL